MARRSESQLAERVRSRAVAEAHFVAEVTNDPDEILESMKSYDPLLTTVVVGNDAPNMQLVKCSTRDEQRAFYAACAHAHMLNVDLFTTLGGGWYGFVHGLTTGRALATGDEYTAELIGLLGSSSPSSPSPWNQIEVQRWWPASRTSVSSGGTIRSWSTSVRRRGRRPEAGSSRRVTSRLESGSRSRRCWPQ